MLTYDLSKSKGTLYMYIYECIKQDIMSGRLATNEKIPSKRTLAKNLGVSIITIENAYEQLISEGYVYALPKRGYFVSEISGFNVSNKICRVDAKKEYNTFITDTANENKSYNFDFSSNQTNSEDFPFSIWTKLMRETISLKEHELLNVSPAQGVMELRCAIANHLSSFRGMEVNPRQIIVGAGTEYLYGLVIKLLGTNTVYCVENPGYKKLFQIYESNGAVCQYVGLDDKGINVDELNKLNVNVVHISPTHHFPTGVTMPISRRYEILSWANESSDRYIIEDDYDSEFRINGKPIAPLYSIDRSERVIYMNTFSKSLTSTIRISYMVLPNHLVDRFNEKLGFYSNTVSTFEQYTLSAFISKGYFEKHINRMRLRYGRRRSRILDIIRGFFTEDECLIVENDSGLHFLLRINTELSDEEVKEILDEVGIRIEAVSDYYIDRDKKDIHDFILNYSGINEDGLESSLIQLKKAIKKDN